ncbi:MAG: fused response regulator/phosphatase [Pseudomonadota bacterium]
MSVQTAREFNAIRQVLVVDDSRLQRRILVSSLRKWGFDVIEAESGERAMEICVRMKPDLVLSDWVMPGMSGLEFCSTFRGMDAQSYSYFILLTSKSEKNEIAQGLDAGADDFLTKPVSSDELRARISAGDRILGMQRELTDKKQQIEETLEDLKIAHEAIDKDLVQARKIQESLVPELTREFAKSRVSLLLKPCGHIGGDLVGMFSPRPDQVGFYSIDVSGHGITSAMMTARLGGFLSSTYFEQNIAMKRVADDGFILRQPDEVASTMNFRLLADTGIEEYFTMAYGIIDERSGIVQMVQAGHPHPMLLRRDGQTEFIGDGGVPIGLLPDVPYHQFEIGLDPGDRLLLYSDGFTECRLANGEMLEPEGLRDLVAACDRTGTGQEFLDDLFWHLTQIMSPEHGLEDDVSATFFEYGVR